MAFPHTDPKLEAELSLTVLEQLLNSWEAIHFQKTSTVKSLTDLTRVLLDQLELSQFQRSRVETQVYQYLWKAIAVYYYTPGTYDYYKSQGDTSVDDIMIHASKYRRTDILLTATERFVREHTVHATIIWLTVSVLLAREVVDPLESPDVPTSASEPPLSRETAETSVVLPGGTPPPCLDEVYVSKEMLKQWLTTCKGAYENSTHLKSLKALYTAIHEMESVLNQ